MTICLAQHLEIPTQTKQFDQGINHTESYIKLAKDACKREESRLTATAETPRAPDFDEELQEHAMQIYADLPNAPDLQVDWNASGPGFVKNEDCNYNVDEALAPGRALAAGARVVLAGLRATYLNGQPGIVTAHLTSGRFAVELTDGRQVKVRPCHLHRFPSDRVELPKQAAPPNETQLQVGTSVRLAGLTEVSLNGLRGTVVTSRTSANRYGIRLPCGRGASIRAQNLEQSHFPM